MLNNFTIILGVLVWKDLLSLEQAKKLKDTLDAKFIPDTIEGVIEELREASE